MAEEQTPVEIVRNEAEERFEAPVAGDLAYLTYTLDGGKLFLLHTEVPPAAEGRGLGGRLVRAALDHARAEGLKVVPFYPFARAYLHRHAEYADLVGEPG